MASSHGFIDFCFSVASSLVASCLFLVLILVFLRPSIKISEIICKGTDYKGEPCYILKFYNTSVFSAFDAEITFLELEEEQAEPKGKHLWFETIELATPHFSVVPRWIPNFMVKNHAYHCFQIRTYHDLEPSLMDKHKWLQVKITLRHGLTGLSKNFIKNYRTTSVVKPGKFELGNSFKVI